MSQSAATARNPSRLVFTALAFSIAAAVVFLTPEIAHAHVIPKAAIRILLVRVVYLSVVIGCVLGTLTGTIWGFLARWTLANALLNILILNLIGAMLVYGFFFGVLWNRL